MVQFIVRRTLLMAPTLLAISVISFVIIELPPGDYVTDYIAGLQMEGTPASEEWPTHCGSASGWIVPGTTATSSGHGASRVATSGSLFLGAYRSRS